MELQLLIVNIRHNLNSGRNLLMTHITERKPVQDSQIINFEVGWRMSDAVRMILIQRMILEAHQRLKLPCQLLTV